ncbi:hypothetical protein CCH79_00006690 [Gambusia affinis]|uniref:Uncharacterized protein n=1 Tax=Gambusia affinis TaxID=33528 RepID=A0A315W9T0_GAMAF|nr:hypothetical protein CCH79_00006690 [Gambusia affinis]
MRNAAWISGSMSVFRGVRRLVFTVTGLMGTTLFVVLDLRAGFCFLLSSPLLSGMKVASFNVQRFGMTKVSDPDVLSTLVKLFWRWWIQTEKNVTAFVSRKITGHTLRVFQDEHVPPLRPAAQRLSGKDHIQGAVYVCLQINAIAVSTVSALQYRTV